MSRYVIRFDEHDPGSLNLRETLLTLSNTYMGVRGIEDERPARSKPGLYIAGMFDKSECLVPEIVNFPDVMKVSVTVGDLEFSSDTCSVSEYRRSLDLEVGCVVRELVFTAPDGKKLRVESTRFLSHYDLQCGGIRTYITPLNFSGEAVVSTEFDGTLLSREGAYAYDEKVKHYHLVKMNDQYEELFSARVRVRDTGRLVEFGHWFSAVGAPFVRRRKVYGERSVESLRLDLRQGEATKIVKLFCVDDSRWQSEEALAASCRQKLARMKDHGFDKELADSAWSLIRLWKDSDVRIEGDDESDLALRFNLFNLVGLGSRTRSEFAVGAKGLSTERYGGHYFWDTEIYVLPYFLDTQPRVARNFLEMRTRTLKRAEARAAENGFEGCLWPWQSDDFGEEGMRQTVLEDGTIERRDILDQYHIVSDVAYAAFRYLQQTGDEAFFTEKALPLVSGALRFWRSFLKKCNAPDAKELHTRKIMGPDEYHVKVDDNYYTNFITAKVFSYFFEHYEAQGAAGQAKIRAISGLSEADLAELKSIGQRIYLPPAREGVLEQFTGYFGLKDIQVGRRNKQGLPLYPDPSVGEGLPDTERQDAIQADATKTQLIKQADAVLTLCLFPEAFSRETIEKTFDYYQLRTLQFSSLSPGVCALAGAIAGRTEDALTLFRLGLNMDLKDVKNETAHGLHTACHGGAYLAVVQGFCGVRAEQDHLRIEPRLPKSWKNVSFNLVHRGHRLRVSVSTSQVQVLVPATAEVQVKLNGRQEKLVNPGDREKSFQLKVVA